MLTASIGLIVFIARFDHLGLNVVFGIIVDTFSEVFLLHAQLIAITISPASLTRRCSTHLHSHSQCRNVGHEAGDEALIHIVRIIKDTLRSMDVVGRFGGEEFIVVLPDTPNVEAIEVIGRLQKELTKRIFMFNNQKLFITFSAGVVTRAPNEEMSEVIKRADEAMYKAKKTGKNRVVSDS